MLAQLFATRVLTVIPGKTENIRNECNIVVLILIFLNAGVGGGGFAEFSLYQNILQALGIVEYRMKGGRGKSRGASVPSHLLGPSATA